MRCPTCKSEDLRVLETRDLDEAIRRRRECAVCGRRFTTFERIDVLRLYVLKRDGRREPYDLVVAATGYHLRVPFVPSDVVPVIDEIPQLIAGVLPERYKNFYFTSFGQPRYGAGPLITAGAKALVAMIRAQPQMEHPIGAVLRRLGEGPPLTALADPFQMMRRSARAVKMMPRIVAREAAIMRANSSVTATMQLFRPW